MLKFAEDKALFPVIVFSFMRAECESFAMNVYNEGSKSQALDFTTAEEKEAIDMVRSIHIFVMNVFSCTSVARVMYSCCASSVPLLRKFCTAVAQVLCSYPTPVQLGDMVHPDARASTEKCHH